MKKEAQAEENKASAGEKGEKSEKAAQYRVKGDA